LVTTKWMGQLLVHLWWIPKNFVCGCWWFYKVYMSFVFKIKRWNYLWICTVFIKGWKWKKGFSIINIRSDYNGEFISDLFESFCEEKAYHHNFSTPRTPQQNVLGGSRKHLLLCFKSCYFKTKVKKDFLWALEMEET
jgi:hypothetical protein